MTDLRVAVAAAVGVDPSAVEEVRSAGGGDTSRTAVAVVDGQRLFVKHLDPPVPGLLASEAAGLRWLADGLHGSPLHVPAVRGHTDGDDGLPAVLVIDHVETGPAAADHDDRLGTGLAAMHRAGADAFGATWPGFVGPLPVPVDPAPDWPTFYGRRRLLPTAHAAAAAGALPPGALAAIERLVDRLPSLLGPVEPPARLHGDLWAGNAIVDATGHPVLVDPAAHGGHREVDLAMMRLFGGFGARTFAAYDEAFPLADGHADRVPLLQLHPLLVHAALFGGGYGRRAQAVVAAYR